MLFIPHFQTPEPFSVTIPVPTLILYVMGVIAVVLIVKFLIAFFRGR